MKMDKITACYVGPQISPEQFVEEHFFLFLNKGIIHGYDGEKHYTLHAGESCLVRKNRLARYSKQEENNAFGKIVFIFDEVFLRSFQKRYVVSSSTRTYEGAFIKISNHPMVEAFLASLTAYYISDGSIDSAFADLKREELLLILLKLQSGLSSVLFDFGTPGRLDLEAFMQKNYKFNVSLERLAFLTGRSLSAFKRDFRQEFHDTPGRWLVKRRLQEAHFLIEHKKLKPADIYLEVGFEDLSHFYFAFKKEFGYTPSAVLG